MRVTFRARNSVLMVFSLLLVAACSREQQDWRSAEGSDSADAYGRFIQRHPDSELVTEARTRIAQLAEDLEWKRAGSADTPEAFRKFLSQYPNGKWSQEARIRIESYSLAKAQSVPVPQPATPQIAGEAASPSPDVQVSAAPDTVAMAVPSQDSTVLGEPKGAPSVQRIAATPAAIQSESAPPVRAAAPVQVAAPMQAPPPVQAAAPARQGYSIQLGAFSSEAAATGEWRKVAERFATELHGLAPRVAPAQTSTGTLYRLQATVSDEARARAICDTLKKRSQACVPVLPH